MKKVLIVPSWQIWPLNSGGAHAQSVFLKDLSNNFEVHMVLTKENINTIEGFQSAFPNVVCHPYDINSEPDRRRSNRVARILKKLLTNSEKINAVPQPYPIERIGHLFKTAPKFEKFIQDLVDHHGYDFIQFEMDFLIPVALCIRTNAKKVLILHELPSLLIRQCIDHLSFDSKFYHTLLETIKEYQQKAFQCFDKVVVFNKKEKSLIAEMTEESKIMVSPFTLNFNSTKKNNHICSDSFPDLLFIGNGHHYPNLQGLTFFMDNIWTELAKSFPELKIHIVGKWQHSIKKKYESERIIFDGKIKDEELDQFLLRSIMISPVLLTSGLRTKILYAAYLGTPMVVHVNEMECLNISNKEETGIKFYSDSRNMILLTSELIGDEHEREQVSKKNKQWFQNNFNYSHCWELRKKVYQS